MNVSALHAWPKFWNWSKVAHFSRHRLSLKQWDRLDWTSPIACLVDIRKAFDSMQQYRPIYKLQNILNLKVVRSVIMWMRTKDTQHPQQKKKILPPVPLQANPWLCKRLAVWSWSSLLISFFTADIRKTVQLRSCNMPMFTSPHPTKSRVIGRKSWFEVKVLSSSI